MFSISMTNRLYCNVFCRVTVYAIVAFDSNWDLGNTNLPEVGKTINKNAARSLIFGLVTRLNEGAGKSSFLIHFQSLGTFHSNELRNC